MNQVPLYVMTCITYISTVLDTLIGPSAIFTLTPSKTTTPLTQQVNTSTFVPTEPYIATTNRSVAIRMTATNATCFVMLTVCIGFAAN